jgi:endonuclease/exonuclease/phosphatase family metal-dependent hydrolase
LRVLLRAPGGYLVVLSTHLGLKRDERTEQIRELRRMVENERYPVILMGDFNCGLDQLGPLNEVLTDTGGLFGAAATFPSAGPAHRIDYIMTSPVLYCRNMYIPLIDASDHLPVVAELTF